MTLPPDPKAVEERAREMFARRGDLSAAWTVLRQGDQAIYRTCAEFSLIREDALVGKIEAERDAARAQVAAVVSILHDIERQSDNRVGIPALEKAAAAHDAEVSRRARAEVLERLAQEWGNDAGAQVVRRFAMRMAAAESTPPTTGGKA